MIHDRSHKIADIVKTITGNIVSVNDRYRSGPSLYFYRRVISERQRSRDVASFLAQDYNIELLYATLVAWDMNSRGAKMKDFDDFKSNLLFCRDEFVTLETLEMQFEPKLIEPLVSALIRTYDKLDLMMTYSKLVSNSKCLHFLFPSLCMPMDGQNTLQYLYGNTGESRSKYVEITGFAFEVMQQPVDFRQYVDGKWNASVPKMIDNAIILLRNTSVK